MNIEPNRIAGAGSATAGVRPVEVQRAKPAVGAGLAWNDAPLTVSVTSGHLSAKSVGGAPLADPRRDDPLGRLVDRVMNLQPPPMPEELKD